MDDNKAIAVLKDSDKAISELMEAFIENEEAKYSKTKAEVKKEAKRLFDAAKPYKLDMPLYFGMWQYSSSGKVDRIKSRVDMDKLYIAYWAKKKRG